jgi:hypothetical protein
MILLPEKIKEPPVELHILKETPGGTEKPLCGAKNHRRPDSNKQHTPAFSDLQAYFSTYS